MIFRDMKIEYFFFLILRNISHVIIEDILLYTRYSVNNLLVMSNGHPVFFITYKTK